MFCALSPLTALLPALILTLVHAVAAPPNPSSSAISFDQIGAEADKRFSGDGIGISAEGEVVRIKARLQALEGEATPEGMWLRSTAAECADKGEKFSLRAVSFGRKDQVMLPDSGELKMTGAVASWLRPGLVEEYRTSVDGVRQDFVVKTRPEGEGELRVALELRGAKAARAAYGARLTLDKSGRELAYHRLHVSDATGRELPARMEVADASCLELHVDDTGAQYPVRVDPTFSDADWVSMSAGVPGVSGVVHALAIDAVRNLVYAGGTFTVAGSVAANNIARWNGTAWSALGSGLTGGDLSAVEALALDAAGNLYAGGSFTMAGGVAANNIARWNGTAWSALGAGLTGGDSPSVHALVVDSRDGFVYAGGQFAKSERLQDLINIARWNGTAWSALGPGLGNNDGDHVVGALALDETRNVLYAAGYFFSDSGATSLDSVARWNVTGTSWSALATGGISGGDANALALDSSGNLYVGGSFTSVGGVSANNIALWNRQGNAWVRLGTFALNGVNNSVNSLAVDSLNNVYVGGTFSTAGGVPARRFAQWNGTTWSARGTGVSGHLGDGFETVLALAVDSANNVYAGGQFATAGGVAANNVARLNGTTGTSWSSLDPGLAASSTLQGDLARALAVDSVGNLYIGGDFTRVAGVLVNRIARWNGSSWSALGQGVNGPVFALATDSGNNLYAGGDFSLAIAGPVGVNNIARWNGTAWSPLAAGLIGGEVFTLATDSADNLYAGGSFTASGQTSVSRVARWNGTAWSALAGGITGGDVFALATDSADNLYVGGNFDSAGAAQNTRLIAKWDGATWSSLAPGIVGVDVLALATDSADNLYAGGRFESAGLVPVNNIARWNGTAWSALSAGLGSETGRVNTLSVDPTDNTLYAGGSFSTAGGVPVNNIAQWNGTAWSGVGSGADNEVRAIAVGRGELFVAGSFGIAGGKVSPYIARALVPVEVISSLTLNGTMGGAFSHQVVATGSPTSYTATGLPDGLSIDGTTGLISGAPTRAGIFSVEITASNASTGRSATANLSVVIEPPPNTISIKVLPGKLTMRAGKNGRVTVLIKNMSTQSVPLLLTFTSSNSAALQQPQALRVDAKGKKNEKNKQAFTRVRVTIVPGSSSGSADLTAKVASVNSAPSIVRVQSRN